MRVGLEAARTALGRPLEWLGSARGRRWLLGALLLVAIGGFVSWVGREWDMRGYILVGDLVLAGKDIYRDLPPGINTWPPFFSLLCVPLALLARLSPYLPRGLWILFNYGLLLFVFSLLGRLVLGRELSLRAEPDRHEISLADPLLFVPLLLTARFVFSNFEHLQVNILIFALTLSGLYLHTRGRDLAGGIWLGCASALKVMPALFIPYLAYRRRWRVAAYASVATLVLSVSPALVYGWSRFTDYIGAWRAALASGWGVGKMNQSVFAMWDRWIGHEMLPFTTSGINRLPESGEPAVLVAYAITVAVVTLAALRTFRDPVRPGSSTAVAEWSVVFLVAAAFGPVSWKAYLVVLLLPHMLLFAIWRSGDSRPRTRRVAGWLLVASFVMGTLTTSGLVGASLSGRFEMSSLVTLATLTVLGGLLWLRVRLGDDAEHPLRAPVDTGESAL